jgi:uncharacterized FlaG/YvyC family protein
MAEQLAGVNQVKNDAGQATIPRTPARLDGARAESASLPEIKKAKVETAEPAEAKAPVTTEELAEMLRRINLTFDLFEVAAKYTVDKDGGQIRVTLINTHTGEVIRRIPPKEFQANFDSFREGLGLLVNRLF